MSRRSKLVVDFSCEEVCRGWDFWTMLERWATVAIWTAVGMRYGGLKFFLWFGAWKLDVAAFSSAKIAIQRRR